MSDVTQIRLEQIVSEGMSQRDRVAIDVMQVLYSSLLERNVDGGFIYALPDGTRFRLVKFFEPNTDEEGQARFGFDVQFEKGHALNHLEMVTRCTGWERNL